MSKRSNPEDTIFEVRDGSDQDLPSSDDYQAEKSNSRRDFPVKWYRSTMFNAFILGLCNFGCPGIWTAMNSLGGGGEEDPSLVNTANALTFCLMVLSCAFSSVLVRYIGIRATLIVGAAGYAPYAAGLYCNNRYQASWVVMLGAALCGLGAGIFWTAEAAIAITYPEPWNKGKFLGLWLTFRIGGQLVGGAISLGLSAANNQAGSLSYGVYEIFIALQAAAPFVGLLLTAPSKVQRSDGVKVDCGIPKDQTIRAELLATAKLLIRKDFLLVILLIAQTVFSEAVYFTFQGTWFSVRSRALASFVSAAMAMVGGNLLGAFLDYAKLSIRSRARASFVIILTMQGAWWIWGTILVTEFHTTRPLYDWTSTGFGRSWTWFLFMAVGFQLNYLYLYFVVGKLANSNAEVIRFSGLLRGVESAVQAVSYGLSSVPIMGQLGCVYLNFGLWGLSLLPAWLVIRKFA